MIYYRVLFDNILFPLATQISRQDPYQAGTAINVPPEFRSVIQRTRGSGFERTIYRSTTMPTAG
jgi:hypothetical protein